MPGRKGSANIESYVNTVSKSGTGAHVFVPHTWIGKRVKITVIDSDNSDQPQQQQKEPPITTKEEFKAEFGKFNRHVKSAARLARRNIDYSPDQTKKKKVAD